MVQLIQQPTRIQAAGNKPKLIDEYIGRVNSQTADVSIARMQSPSGWQEPWQTPEFDEYTVVLRGILLVETKDGINDVRAGQAVITRKNDGTWVVLVTSGYNNGTDSAAKVSGSFVPNSPAGDGKGYLAAQYDPRPRNFLCTATINGIEDGQLFWIIQNGSPGTAMPPSGNLTDIQIWSIVNYLRKLAQPQ